MKPYTLVRHVRDHGPCPMAELVRRFGVSERTVRKYARIANDSLGTAATIRFSRPLNGYVLDVTDVEGLERWLARQRVIVESDDSTPESRVTYLLVSLLSRSAWVTVGDLAAELYVSPQRVSADLRHVETILGRFDLSVERRPRYGLRVSGAEMDRRLCLASQVSGTMVTGKGLPRPLGDETTRRALEVITATLGRSLGGTDIKVSSLAFQNLVVNVLVAVIRIREGGVIPMEAAQLEAIRDRPEFDVASSAMRSLGAELGVSVPEEETAYVALLLTGNESLNRLVVGGPDQREEDGIVIPDPIWDIVGEMLKEIRDAFGLDFREDLELRMNLARHLVPLSVRLRYGMRVDNPLLNDIKMRFPMAYAMALDAQAVLESRYGSRPSEAETGYVALSFALALERLSGGISKKNILVVCASGQGSARLLESRYLRRFGEYIDSCSVCDVASLDRVDFSRIDYVFTTVHIDRPVPVPVREVTYFLGDGEAKLIRQILGGQRNALGMYDEFSPDLFLSHLGLADKEDVLDLLCERMSTLLDVGPGFRDSVRRRESAAPTSFGNLVAMPHPLEAFGEQTFVCVGLLDSPIPWDDRGTEVQAVFLISFASKRTEGLNDFFNMLADLFLDEDAIRTLVTNQDWKTLTKILEGAKP